MLEEEEVFFRMLNKLSVWERECGRGWSREKGQDDPGSGGKSVSEKSQTTVWPAGTPFRNQLESWQNFSSVKWKTNGWRRMVLSSSSGGVTFLLKKMILGNLKLFWRGRNIWSVSFKNRMNWITLTGGNLWMRRIPTRYLTFGKGKSRVWFPPIRQVEWVLALDILPLLEWLDGVSQNLVPHEFGFHHLNLRTNLRVLIVS